jgi:hypothetical protein
VELFEAIQLLLTADWRVILSIFVLLCIFASLIGSAEDEAERRSRERKEKREKEFEEWSEERERDRTPWV